MGKDQNDYIKEVSNRKLSEIFSEMAAMYRYIGLSQRFRSAAYNKASRVIASLPDDVSSYVKAKSLGELPGIGEGISAKIQEFIQTGKVRKYEELKKHIPLELIKLLDVRGFGPQSVKRIHDDLDITTIDELTEALKDGSLAKLPGFGKKKIEGMMRGLKLLKSMDKRMFLVDALKTGESIVEWLKRLPEVKQVELAGSIRRMKETIGDIDVLVCCEDKDRDKIARHFTQSTFARQVIARGNTKVSIIHKSLGKQVDLRIVDTQEWGSALQYFTGSKEHNIHLRSLAKRKGFKISEYGVFSIATGKRIAGITEEEIYRVFDCDIMPPEMREDSGEIELAMADKLPSLVSFKQIQGDMHIHSSWSDGINSLDEIVKYIRQNYSYEYIVITDHSKPSRIAHGMNEKRILEQINVIDELNKKLGSDFVKKGIEVDILADGRLDVSDEILKRLDWVTASIHSKFNQDNTDRIIRAIENPVVNCIGHLTGRLIGSREGYKVDLKELLAAAGHYNTALEINAQPLRMDLNDEMAMMACKSGVKLVIATDAHNLADFELMKIGVSIARRAWCTPGDILNTMSWKELRNAMRKR